MPNILYRRDVITVADYFNSTKQEQEDERNRRGWTPKPPAAHTHRGASRSPVLAGHHEATKPERTPTHRAEGDPVIKPEHQRFADFIGIRYA